MLIESANGRVFVIPDEIKELYSKDIDFQKCLLHLQMLPDAIKSTRIPIQQVTLISTICDVFNETSTLKMLLSEVHKVLKIYLTIPITTANAERCFSALKRIKTYLRTSMTEERLNNSMILHVHRDQLNLEAIAKEFINNDRRKFYFGNF